MSKIPQTKLPVELTEVLETYDATPKTWRLVRERDGQMAQSEDVMWLEWDETGRFKSNHADPAVGRSLLMSPFNQFFTWQTTVITEIVEQRGGYIKFRTTNSVYELFKLDEA